MSSVEPISREVLDHFCNQADRALGELLDPLTGEARARLAHGLLGWLVVDISRALDVSKVDVVAELAEGVS